MLLFSITIAHCDLCGISTWWHRCAEEQNVDTRRNEMKRNEDSRKKEHAEQKSKIVWCQTCRRAELFSPPKRAQSPRPRSLRNTIDLNGWFIDGNVRMWQASVDSSLFCNRFDINGPYNVFKSECMHVSCLWHVWMRMAMVRKLRLHLNTEPSLSFIKSNMLFVIIFEIFGAVYFRIYFHLVASLDLLVFFFHLFVCFVSFYLLLFHPFDWMIVSFKRCNKSAGK